MIAMDLRSNTIRFEKKYKGCYCLKIEGHIFYIVHVLRDSWEIMYNGEYFDTAHTFTTGKALVEVYLKEQYH